MANDLQIHPRVPSYIYHDIRRATHNAPASAIVTAALERLHDLLVEGSLDELRVSVQAHVRCPIPGTKTAA